MERENFNERTSTLTPWTSSKRPNKPIKLPKLTSSCEHSIGCTKLKANAQSRLKRTACRAASQTETQSSSWSCSRLHVCPMSKVMWFTAITKFPETFWLGSGGTLLTRWLLYSLNLVCSRSQRCSQDATSMTWFLNSRFPIFTKSHRRATKLTCSICWPRKHPLESRKLDAIKWATADTWTSLTLLTLTRNTSKPTYRRYKTLFIRYHRRKRMLSHPSHLRCRVTGTISHQIWAEGSLSLKTWRWTMTVLWSATSRWNSS